VTTTVSRLTWACAALLALSTARAQAPSLPPCAGADPQVWNQCTGTWEDRARDFFYAGEFRNGRPGGLGVLRTGASLYAGEFVDGRVHGHGVLTFLGDRSKYVGEFREGTMHGRGTTYRADGSVAQAGVFEGGVLRQADPAPVPALAPPPVPLPAPVASTAPPVAAAPPAAAPARPRVPAVAAQPGFAAGRVTMPDGGRLGGRVQEVAVSINGISIAGERVSYSPEVGDDGVYRQRLAPGQYRFGTGAVTVRLGEREFRLPLEPVGERWNRNRDAADGIAQDFVWKTTGATPNGRSSGQETNNHTHWYGAHVGVRWQTWRADTNRGTTSPPAGAKLRFTVRPLTPTVDGRQLAPFVVERDWDPRAGNNDLNDLPPADLEITGIVLLPDGSSKPMRFQGRGDYPNFKPALQAPLTPGGVGNAYAPLNAGWVVD
jgi:hypothetical protein